MRVRLAGLSSFALAVVLAHCSLVVDTDGLTGGPAEAGLDSDGMIHPNVEGGGGVDGATTDGAIAPGALGPVWLAYGTTTGVVGVRSWNADTSQWSAELPGPNLSGAAVRWVVPKETPVGSFVAIVSQGAASAKLDVFQRTAEGTWNLGFSQPMPVSARRAFDIEYESKANGVIVAYGDGTSNPKARRFSAGTWSNEVDIGKGGSLAPQWLELARSPISDEVALVYADDGNNLVATRWDGAAWQSKPEGLEADLNTLDWKCFDAAYENSTGKLVVAWGRTMLIDGGSDRGTRYRFRQPGAPDFGGSLDTPGATPPGSIVMVPEVGSKRLAVSYVEYFCNREDNPCDDFGGMIWDGNQFDVHPIDLNTNTLYNSRPGTALTSVAWVGATGHIVAAYHRDLNDVPGQLAYARRVTSWSEAKGASALPDIGPRVSVQLASVAGSKVVAVVEDSSGLLWSKVYSEDASGNTVWMDAAGDGALVSPLVTVNGVPFGIAGQ